VTDHVLVEHFAGNTKAAKFYEREGWTVVSTEPSRSGDPNAAVIWRRVTLDTRGLSARTSSRRAGAHYGAASR
jgi:hypothetical protein